MEEGYSGQVNVVILGSNDHRIIGNMLQIAVDRALKQFHGKLETFLDKMLNIQQSAVILVTTTLPKQCVHPGVQAVARRVVR